MINVKSQIFAAQVAVHPFEHFVIPGVAGGTRWQLLLDALPDDHDYDFSTGTGRGTFSFSRNEIRLLDRRRQHVIRDVQREMLSHSYARVVLGKFEAQLRRRLSEIGPQAEIVAQLKLFLDKEGYHLPVHTDHPDRFCVVLFYLPTDRSLSELGTRLYRPKQAGFTCRRGGVSYPENDFELVKHIPFEPSFAVGFHSSERSFHSVPRVPCGHQRDLLGYILRVRVRQRSLLGTEVRRLGRSVFGRSDTRRLFQSFLLSRKGTQVAVEER